MKILSYKEKRPKLNSSHFIADGVVLIGDLVLGDSVNIWYNSVVRADVNQIKIGDNTNIQDLSMLHVTEQFPLTIGKNVSVGHSAILHGCIIGDGCLIGMGAKILDGAKIEDNCLVAAGSIVPPNKTYPSGSLIMGSPAKVVKALSEKEIESIANHYKAYVGYAKKYKEESRVD